MSGRGQASLGQLTATAVSAASASEWVRSARPGEELVYFSGPVLIQSLPVVTEARRLEQAGEVLFFQRRKGPGLFDYVMQKRRNAEPRVLSRAGVEPLPRRTVADEQLEDLMAVLRRLASLGLDCPSNAKLAQMAGLNDAESARYRLGLLDQQGRITVRTLHGQRVITVVASGLSTARGGPR